MPIADDMEYMDFYEEECEERKSALYELGCLIGYMYPNGTVEEFEDEEQSE